MLHFISFIVKDYLDFDVTTMTEEGLISNESINDLVLKLHLADYNNYKLETNSQDLVATTILIGLLYYPVLVVYILNKGILKTSEFIKTFTKLNK